MKIYVQKNSIYFNGSFKEVLTKLNQLSQKYTTLQEAINSFLN